MNPNSDFDGYAESIQQLAAELQRERDSAYRLAAWCVWCLAAVVCAALIVLAL